MRKIYFILLIILFPSLMYSANEKQMIVNRITNDIGKNNYGTEFYLSIPPALSENLQNTNNTIRIYAMPLADGKITLTIQSKNYKTENTVKAGEISEFILTPELAQPYIKTGDNIPVKSDIYRAAGIYLSSDVAFSCYAVIIYNNSTESMLAYPTNLLGKQYTISTYNDPVAYYPILNSLPAIITITSPYNDNEITFTMGGNNNSKTSDGLLPNNKVTRTLQKGDVWVISSDGKNSDLSGSFIDASLPVSVISANQFSNVPLGTKPGNYTIEMEVATKSWSHTYFVGNSYNRKSSKIVRIYAKEANTEVRINNYPVGTITEPYGIINNAYLEIKLSDISDSKFYAIQSDKEIYVVSYSVGTEDDGVPIPIGGTFKQIVSPYQQFTKSTFFSLPANSLSDFANHYLNIITELDDNMNLSDSLLLFQFNISKTLINKVKDLKLLQKRVLYGIDGKNYSLVTLEIKNEGAYSIISDKPFFAEMYGNKNTLSYGMPASLNLKDLSSTDELAPIVKWNIKCGGIIEGTTEDIADKSSLPSNIAGHLFISNESQNIKLIEIDKIIPGTQKLINWKLKVLDINQYAKAKIKFWDAASNVTDAIIEYYPTQINFDKKLVNFGSFKFTESTVKSIYLINNSNQDITIPMLSLKYGDRGFHISNGNNNIAIPANNKYEILISFTGLSDGLVFDSLGIADTCGTNYSLRLEANVGSPIISVSDINFGDNIINTSVTQVATIKNIGVSNLIVNGYRLYNSDQLIANFNRIIDPANPLIIAPGDNFDFQITYNVKYDASLVDSIVFISDAISQDSVCTINARGLQPGLTCTSIDWGKKRIHRNNIPAGPYLPDNEDKAFVVYNKGKKDLKINSYKLIEQNNPESFEINLLPLNNKEIKQGDKVIIPAAFRPIVVGESKLLVELTDEYNNKTQAELKGFGVVPQLKSNIEDFGSVLIQTFANPKIIQFSIHNLSYDEWQYADTAVIFDITSDDQSISENWDEYSSMGFKFDKSKLTFPIKLAPGQSLLLPIGFAPNTVGSKIGNLNIVSDEYQKSEFVVKGSGIEQNFTVSDSYSETCINTENIFTSIIANHGNTELNILPLNFSEYISEISFVNDDDIINGFKLEPQTQKEIKMIFKPLTSVEKSTNLLVRTKENPDLVRKGKIIGKALAYRINSFISPLEQISAIGEKSSITINIDAPIFNENTAIRELSFDIEYNPKAIRPDIALIKYSKSIEGKFYTNTKINKPGLMSVELKSLNGAAINQATDLMDLVFDTYYPNDSLNYSDININNIKVDNNCIDFRNSMGRINIKQECVSQLRQFNMSGDKYYLTPKVLNNDLNIQFGIGIKSNCTIKVFNISGEQIFSDYYQELANGEYNAIFPIQSLSSGIYFVEISSGPYTKTEKVIIYK